MWETANIRLKIKIQKSSSNRCRSSWLDDPLLQSNFPWDESKAKPEEFNRSRFYNCLSIDWWEKQAKLKMYDSNLLNCAHVML